MKISYREVLTNHVCFVGSSAEPHKTYIERHAWFVNTSLWLIYINLQPPKTGDSQNQKV